MCSSDLIGELIVLESPFGCDKQVFRRLTDEAFQYQILSQESDVPDDDINVLLHRIYMERMLGILLRQSGTLDDLHLMNLQDIKRQRRNDRCLSETFFRIFSWQSDDDMPARQNASRMSPLYRITAAGEIMTAIDSLQGDRKSVGRERVC